MQTQTAARLGEFGALVAGTVVTTGAPLAVRSPYDGSTVALARNAGSADVERAIATAAAAFAKTRGLPSWRRALILEHIAAAITQRRDELAAIVALEAGKPIRTARLEVDRAAFVFRVGAEEAKRINGEILPLDWLPGTEGREGHVRRVPLGPVAGITPFNFPILLVAHKVAPAIAAGDPIIIRPAPRTPISALVLGRIILDAGWPEDALSVFPCSLEDTARLVEDERIKLLTFTGSAAVGWSLKSRAGRKRVTLELGGNAAVIVHADADVAYAAERVALAGYSYAGQSCISAQRIYVHTAIYDAFAEQLVPRVTALKAGDPMREDTDVGPVIDDDARTRLHEWIEESGGEVRTGGEQNGLLKPTVLVNVPDDAKISCEEAFGPVVVVNPFDSFDEAVARANGTRFGLQAGVFTRSLDAALDAADRLEFGGVVVNEAPTFRSDQMPYGGVKSSGNTKEGPAWAVREMTEERLVVIQT